MTRGRGGALGFRAIRLLFDLDSEADDEHPAEPIQRAERYCVVLRTRASPADVTVAWSRSRG